jgi:hypothetical protein
MSIINKSDLLKEGFTCLAGPYAPDDEHMIHAAVQDALRANKDVRAENTRNGVYLWHRSKLGR